MRIKNLLAFTILTMFFISCKDTSSKQKGLLKKPLPVIEVAKRDINTYTIYPANITGQITSEIRPKIVGYIKRVLVDEGQEIKKGQLLFELETTELTQSALAAKANVTNSQVEVDRLTPLVEKNIIGKAQLATAQAQLEEAKAKYQNIIASIQFAKLKSPIFGKIGRINFKVGALVGPANALPLASVSNTQTVYAYFTLTEKEYINFFNASKGTSLKQKITNFPLLSLELADGSLYTNEGILKATTGHLDKKTGTIQFRADFENSTGLLNEGSSGNIRVPHTYKNALIIPESSTFESQGITYVYKLQGDSIINTPIKLKDRVNNVAIIKSGLKAKDVILAKGVAQAKNGMKIIPQPTNINLLINIKSVK